MNCSECLSSPVNVPKITLPCECIHCMSCLTAWIIERLYYVRKSDSAVHIICPNSECLRPFRLKEILPSLREDLSSKIKEAMAARGLKPFSSEGHQNSDLKDHKSGAWESVKEKICNLKVDVIDAIYASCPSCHRVTDKNRFCINKLCSKCDARYYWVCKGRADPYSYCIGTQCSKYKIMRFVIQLVFLVLFFEISGIFSYMLTSWYNAAHIAMAVCALFIISKISFMTLFYHKGSLPDSWFLIAGIVISLFVLYGMPVRYLLELMMLKVGVNIILDWIFPPVLA